MHQALHQTQTSSNFHDGVSPLSMFSHLGLLTSLFFSRQKQNMEACYKESAPFVWSPLHFTAAPLADHRTVKADTQEGQKCLWGSENLSVPIQACVCVHSAEPACWA